MQQNINHARELARDYFRKWYEQASPQSHNMDNPDEFESIGGSVRLKIKAARQLHAACKALADYTSQLLCLLDKKVNFENFQELRQANRAFEKSNRIFATRL